MPLFEPRPVPENDEFMGSDAATRALSVAAVENDFVAKVYENIAWAYDWTFGPTLHPGRLHAIERMAIQPGDRVLEVGVGTGINAMLYPAGCTVTGIDLSDSMLEKRASALPATAQQRPSSRNGRRRPQVQRQLLLDIVYAPYLISVVPDPVAVAREMRRVCRPGGRHRAQSFPQRQCRDGLD
jgi:phosphatidylethanolamine/phosphatidyl-N-methylethanolamine N-methyltransferase